MDDWMMEEEEDSKDAYFSTYSDDILDQEAAATVHNRRTQQRAPIAPLPELKHGPRVMKRGDVVYWSDLVTGGERSEPVDPDRILEVPICTR